MFYIPNPTQYLNLTTTLLTNFTETKVIGKGLLIATIGPLHKVWLNFLYFQWSLSKFPTYYLQYTLKL